VLVLARTITLDVPYPPDVCAERLAARMVTWERARPRVPRGFAWAWQFQGAASAERFRVTRFVPYPRPLDPRMTGTLTSSGPGTRVQARVGVTLWELVLTLPWLVLLTAMMGILVLGGILLIQVGFFGMGRITVDRFGWGYTGTGLVGGGLLGLGLLGFWCAGFNVWLLARLGSGTAYRPLRTWLEAALLPEDADREAYLLELEAEVRRKIVPSRWGALSRKLDPNRPREPLA
jgi:hypothetical protein